MHEMLGRLCVPASMGIALIATSKNVIAADEKLRPMVIPNPRLFMTCDTRGTLGL